MVVRRDPIMAAEQSDRRVCEEREMRCMGMGVVDERGSGVGGQAHKKRRHSRRHPDRRGWRSVLSRSAPPIPKSGKSLFRLLASRAIHGVPGPFVGDFEVLGAMRTAEFHSGNAVELLDVWKRMASVAPQAEFADCHAGSPVAGGDVEPVVAIGGGVADIVDVNPHSSDE